jgi:hypothetical protein
MSALNERGGRERFERVALSAVSTISALNECVERSEHVECVARARAIAGGALSAVSTIDALNERVERSEHDECVERARRAHWER